MRYLLDTNVMLLLLVGTADVRWIGEHRRTKDRFTGEHFSRLLSVLGAGVGLSTTSNVLTEVANLAAQIGEPRKMRLRQVLGEIIEASFEVHLPGSLVVADPYFLRLGLTDALILRLERGEHHVLSVDGPLCLACHAVGLPCTNLTPHLFE